ncbi:phage Gp37/Gp68 family protein [Burkholderia gladioli]|uniref:phage Gp37/Gp68 family protein n=1 Tax=Burkholderia gladioli TaxID=28095 RepID=UPI00164057F2|nr:phage Gp37/Gp68 family protein [Burkholderia gladioli]
MSENSKIEWTDHTFSPWMGCTKISPGCDNCYAEAMMDTRLRRVKWGAGQLRARTSTANWREPARWNAKHEEFFAANGRRQRVFCSSLADVFDNAVPAIWRRDLGALIESTPNLDWLLLTKRIGNAGAMLVDMFPGGMPNHVWLGATVVNQDEADRDVPKLLATPAHVRFLSIEPMLGPIDLGRAWHGEAAVGGRCPGRYLPALREVPRPSISWVIAGGESGPGARPAHPDWFRSLRDQCAETGVAFFFKQWGDWSAPGVSFPDDRPALAESDELARFKVGKRAAGRMLDGRTHDEFPENTR